MVCRGYGLPPTVLDMLLSDINLHCNSAEEPVLKQSRRILVDIIEKESEFEIVADVPGVAKEAIHLDIDKDTLTLSVSQPDDETPGADAPAATPGDIEPATEGGEQAAAQAAEALPQPKVLRRERAQRYAKRALKLPETADLGQAQAECVAGVLTVTVPKRALPSPHRIPIA